MDHFSLAASAIAVATLTASTCSAIAKLRSLCKGLPGRIHAIGNEVADLEVVLNQVATLLKERSILLGSEQTTTALPQIFFQARLKLTGLASIVDRLTAALSDRTILSLKASTIWLKTQGQVQTLQEDIRTVKSSLNILLGASNSQDMVKVRLEIQEISAPTRNASTQSTYGHLAMTKIFMNTMAGIDERVARVEALVQTQTQLLQERQFSQIGSSYGSPSTSKELRSFSKPGEPASTNADRATDDGVSLRVRPFATTCRANCPCCCHTQQRSAAPAILNNLLGRLFVSYSGLPVSVEYWFPMSILSTIIKLQIGTSLHGGPSLQLKTFRRVPDSAQCVEFAQKGNMRGLQHLFKKGLASPRDVSASRGYTLLRWALYAKQYETVKFLVHAGADTEYRPISEFDNSPRIKACHFLLEGGLSETATDALRTITQGSEFLDDFIDSSKFTKIHKIVLGLSLQNLEEELFRNPGDMNTQDSMGRTPLAWAAAKGDIQTVATLLSYGADPNIMDVQISGPLSNAAAQGHTACVELLLEAGADPDPIPPRGIQKGSLLSVASRNSTDAVLLKRLLDFGANVDTRTVEGKTPLFHATRNDNVSFAMLFLEYGADLNATTITGETPLTTAITFNSHNVLRLFLERWSEYTVCPRLKAPNLVEITALYGDVETMNILAKASHFQSKHDKEYTLGDYKSHLLQREDITEELIPAFDQLLNILNAAPDLRKGDDLLESGFFSCFGSKTDTPEEDGFIRMANIDGVVLDLSSEEKSVESFHDAIEKLELLAFATEKEF